MGIRLHCDRCQRFIKIISMKDFKDQNEFLCKTCEDVERRLKVQIDKIARKAQAEFTKLANNFKDLVTEEIQKAVKDDGYSSHNEGH